MIVGLLVVAVCPIAMIVAIAVLGRSAGQRTDTNEIDQLPAEVARLGGRTDNAEHD